MKHDYSTSSGLVFMSKVTNAGRQSQYGFSLVELMVALAISGFLMLGLVRVFDSNRQNTLLSDSYARVQESARIAQTIMARKLRMIGYDGCVTNAVMSPAASISDSGFFSKLDPTDPDYSDSLTDYSSSITAIDNWDNADAKTYAGIFGTREDGSDIEPVPNSDVLITRGANDSDLTVETTPSSFAANIKIAGPQAEFNALEAGDILLVTDCDTNARLFSITNWNPKNPTLVHNGGNNNCPGCIDNTTGSMGYKFPKGSQVLKMSTAGWFVAESDYFEDNAGNPVSSLFKVDARGQAQELVPYVDDLQIEYAVDEDEDEVIDGYYTADQLQDIIDDGGAPAGVTSVKDFLTNYGYAIRIELVISGGAYVNAPQIKKGMTSRNDDGKGQDYPNDGYLRKVYTSVVQIRNNPSTGNI